MVRRLLVKGDLEGAVKVAEKLVEAERYHREALEGRRRVLGNDHPDTLNSISNLGWGMMADRMGFRSVFVWTLVMWLVAVAGLMLSTDLTGFFLAFVGIGAGMGGFLMAAQNMVLEFGNREDLPLRIAAANSAQEGVGAIGPLIGGVIVVFSGLEALFLTAGAFLLAAIALVLLRVDEPRHRSA